MSPKTLRATRKRPIQTAPGLLFDEALTSMALQLTAPDVDKSRAAEILAPVIAGRQVASDFESTEVFDAMAMYGDIFSLLELRIARDHLLRFCPRIASTVQGPKGAAARAELSADYSKRVRSLDDLHLEVTASGLRLASRRESVLTVAVLALLPFFEPSIGWPASRLAQCELPECNRWFLRAHKAGTAAKYCCQQHGSRHRVRILRQGGRA